MNLLTQAAYVFIVTLLASCMVYIASQWINMPVVAINQYDDCEWIREAPDFEKRVCPLVLPEKYEKVYVFFDDEVDSYAPDNIWVIVKRDGD